MGVTLALPIAVSLVVVGIYMAVPRLRARRETRRNWRAAERHFKTQQQDERISY